MAGSRPGDGDRRQQRTDLACGRGHVAPPVSRRQLRMRGELGRRPQPRVRDAGRVEAGLDLGGCQLLQCGLDDRRELVVAAHPVGVGRESRVIDQLGPTQDLPAEHRPFPLVLQAEEDLPVSGRVRAVGRDRCVPGAGAAWRLAAVDAE